MPQADKQAGGNPQPRHQRDEPLQDLCHVAQAANDNQQGEHRQHAAGDNAGQIEGIGHRMRHRVGLNGVKNNAIGEQQQD